MNKNEIEKLENLLKLITNLGKYQYFLEELLEKEKVKRERHIANVKKYNDNINSVDSNNTNMDTEVEKEKHYTFKQINGRTIATITEEHDDLD